MERRGFLKLLGLAPFAGALKSELAGTGESMTAIAWDGSVTPWTAPAVGSLYLQRGQFESAGISSRPYLQYGVLKSTKEN